MTRTLFTALAALGMAAAPAAAAPPTPAKTLESSGEVLDALAAIPLKGIPPALLADAQGVAIIPKVIKAGFVVGGRGGHGVVLAKAKDGTWADPVFVDIGGASIGAQIGVESTDVVLVFRTRKSLDRILEGKEKLTLGADASVAAGPVGRTATAATDAKLEAEIVSYSRSRGLFAGVSLDGAVIRPDVASNVRFQPATRRDDRILADTLKVKLIDIAAGKVKGEPVPVTPPATVPVVRP